ncbi:MAG: HDOD domain-containing protein [Candidatus Hydrogenedentes bacterium]|nr:HDOD domain-containing protein [Candidatus Hydrogenedentota bacterium]
MPISPEHIERKIVELANLPTLPGILKKVSLMTGGGESSAADVAKVISTDQVLTAKLLRLVNSPVYGFPGRISSVTHAVVLLGFNVVKGLVMGTAVFDTLGASGQGLWKHSLGCAIVSRKLAQQIGHAEPEEIMVAGLLHDLGKVALTFVFPNEYQKVVEEARASGRYVGDVEREVFGVTHTRVSSWLAAEWHFPARLAEPLTYHHNPELAKTNRDATCIVHVGDILTRGMGYGHPGDDSMPPLNHEAFQSLGISFTQIDKALEDAEIEFTTGVANLTYGD